MTKKKIKGLKSLYYLFLKDTNKFSNEKLEALLRARVHAIEKHGNIEETTDFLSMVWGRKLYHEAKKRKILSSEEIEWCETILFGKQVIKMQTQITYEGLDNKLFDIIKERRSIRTWQDVELDEKKFELLLDAAKWAPSSSHRQPWHFLLTRDKEKINMLSEIRGQKFVKNAPNCILALINMKAYKGEEIYYTPYLDAGAAIQNLLLMAHSMGLGACWVNFGKMEVSSTKLDKVKKVFGIPKDIQIVSIIPIGKLTGTLSIAPGRKDTKNIMHIEKF